MEEHEEALDDEMAATEVASVITCMKWIPRQSLMDRPFMYELSALERERMENAEEENSEEDEAQDKEERELEEEEGDNMLASQLEEMQLNREAMNVLNGNDADSELGSDADDHILRPTDEILVTASVEDDQASLEVHAYDHETGSFYVHHDICLPAYPLCIEFVGVSGQGMHFSETNSVSFLAVGTFQPEIEVWNLDVMNALEPNLKLVGNKDAVLGLSWNAKHANLLASAGADKTIRLFDLETQTNARTFAQVHKDKVQTVAWNPAEPSVLLSGSFDQTVALLDCRQADGSNKPVVFPVNSGDIESIVWDVHNPALFGCSTDRGVVAFFDVRLASKNKPLFKFQAHDKACSQLTGNARVPGMYATCSADKTVKIWDLQHDLQREKPSSKLSANKQPVSAKRMKSGKLFTCQFATNVDFESRFDPFLLASAGSKGHVALWHAGGDEDDDQDEKCRAAFTSERVLPAPKRW